MSAYCTDKKREEEVSGKWYVRMLIKIIATFTEHLICAGHIPGALSTCANSQHYLTTL